MPDQPFLISGGIGSPYTRKLRALLIYRRIPYQFLNAPMPGQRGRPDLPKPPLPLLPCLYFPENDGTYRAGSDTSPLIRELEGLHDGRSVIPPDPAVAFLSSLVEDYADEWVTKPMFHYRWGTPDGLSHANNTLPLWMFGTSDEAAESFAGTFGQRQVDRLSGVVAGSIEKTGPIIEASYVRLVEILRDHFAANYFLFGSRPSNGDFGLHGQLTQLVQVEPTSMAIARETAPRVMAWVDLMDDLSGLEVADDGWTARDELGSTFDALLGEIGRTYAPFMVANAEAYDNGDEQVRCIIDGQDYWQKPFPYQRKCLGWMREERDALGESDRDFVDTLLDGTGCEALFA
jgi:glutathione S-transferase